MPDAPSTAPAPKGDVKVPGVGNVDRKWVFAGLAASAGIVVYAYWRRSQAPAESPVEGDQYATGDEYTPDAYIGATSPGGETYDPNDIETNIPTTNAEWSQRVIDALESVGYDRMKAATTVGKYLGGQPLDATEKLIMQVALAMLGNPPAGALPIISAPAGTTPPPNTGGTGTGSGTGTADVPRGDRVNVTQSLESYARHFSKSTSADSVEATKRQILTLNPWLKAAIYGPKGKPYSTPHPVKAGWIIIVPRGIQR
jgi:hypothetical protein